MSIPRGFTQLQIESWSNAVRTVRLAGILDGIPFVHEHVTAGDRSLVSELFFLDTHKHSLPQTVNASVAAAVRRGEIYVRISVVWSNSVVQRLSAAYLTGGKTIAWPPGVFESSTEGQGLLRTILGTNPAAGAEVIETVPANARWRVKAVYLFFDTDATVIDRLINFSFDDAANIFLTIELLDTLGANELGNVYLEDWGFQEAAFSAADRIKVPMPPQILFQGWRFFTTTTNIQAGDNYGNPIFTVEEWIEE